jgi:menaquinone-dependent protoporphyrinogen IX oxidase
MNGIILYKGKYGATRQYAEWLGEALNLPVHSQGDLKGQDLSLYDFVIVGSSVYMGRLLIREWLAKNVSNLKSKVIFLFIVSATAENEKERTQKIINENIPPLLQQGYNIFFLLGRVIKSKLTWRDRWLVKIGARLEKDPARKKVMMEDMDAVKKENITEMLKVINMLTSKIDVAPDDRIPA